MKRGSEVRPLGAAVPDKSVEVACESACKACPWRVANQGTKHPHGWYTKKNLQRLWAGMRRGEMMSCHPTDPRVDVPNGKHAPEDATTRECAGILILLKREMQHFYRYVNATGLPQDEAIGPAFASYRKERPFGLTRIGLVVMAQRTAWAGVPLVGGKPMPNQELDNAEIGYPPLGQWPP